MYDIVFISYGEKNAEKNWELLKSRFPVAKRVSGVKGIHEAHIKAAKKCFTKMIWVVDADSVILDDFNFDYEVPEEDLETVHVWRSVNPVNGLEYGYGGVKLLPKKKVLNMDKAKVDMTTGISNYFKAIPEVSNVTEFNVDEFSTWKSAFRESVKLASKVIDRQNTDDTDRRLDVWCNVGEDKPYGNYSIEGAKSGRHYVLEENGDPSLINDFEWLKERFDREYNV